MFRAFAFGRVVRLALAVAWLHAAGGLPAQVRTGSVGGRITDAAGKALAGARVEIVSLDTGRSRASQTSASGDFVLDRVAPGAYRLDVGKDGYRTHVQEFELLLNQEARVDVQLLPGNRTERVQVSAPTTLLRTENSAIGAVIENHQLRGLPLDGRNFYELSLLLPGTAPAPQGSAGSGRGDLALNINGAREDSNSHVLDGIYSGDPKLNGFGVTPPVDGVREFEVLTNSYDASFGRNAGGQINVILNSGANRLHGTVYEFSRNAALDARNYFAPAGEEKPKYNRNQFGFSLGGPVRRDRTFFFADFEGRRVRDGKTLVTNVPTLKERGGDFSESPFPIIDPYFQSPFPGNRIPAERLDPVGVAIAKLYPAPNRNRPGRNYVSSPSQRDRNDQFDLRVDHALSLRDELTARYSFGDRALYEPFAGGAFAQVPGYGNNVAKRFQNALASHTHVFTPALLNELRLGFNRIALGILHQNSGASLNRQVGMPDLATNPLDQGLSLITVTGYSPLGDEYFNPQRGVTNTYQVNNQTSWARTRHLVRFGFDFRNLQQNAFRNIQGRGIVNFTGFSGSALSELLQGIPSYTGGAQTDNPQHLRTRSYNFFVQDAYRIRPDLVLSLGARYEYNTPAVDPANRATLYDDARGGLTPVGQNGMPRGGYFADRNNFGPRVGLAWNPGRAGTVLRAGYGVYYDQSALAPGEGLYFNAPYYVFQLYFSLPAAPLSLRNPFPANYPLQWPASALAFQRDLRTPYIQHWSFGVQQQIGPGRVVEVAYVGSKGTKLISGRDINQPAPGPRQPNLRPNPLFADVNRIESRGNSNYNSLQVRVQQRLRHGVSLLAGYTWAKSIDDASNFFPSAGDPSYPQDSAHVRAERARSGFDLRHRLSVAYSYELPLARKHRWAGGWQTFGILTLQTGRPFTVALPTEFDNSNTGRSSLGFGANDRPNVIRDPRLSDPTPERWFDTRAFTVPAYGTFGNAGRNILDGPGLATLNMSVVKDTRITEGLTMQFRLESFNLFNRPNFDLPGLFVGGAGFGSVLSAQSPRHVQLGLKFLF
ncbi:MAG: TonB-dependent receptor domain-containing protein [Bryobacteraceae bacterium]